MKEKLSTAERLKDLRKSVLNIKLEELAEKTGLSRSALGNYEKDDCGDISSYALITLAKFYGVSTDYILGLTEDKAPAGKEAETRYFSQEVLDLLKSGKINRRLLSEIILHKDFRRLMTDIEIAVDRHIDQQIQGIKIATELLRMQLMSQFGTDEDDVNIRTMAFTQESDDIYLAHVIHEELDEIIKDIRSSHETDVTTADEDTMPDMDALQMLVGSAAGGATKEDLAMQVMGMIGIPEKKQSEEDAKDLLRIVEKSDHAVTQKRMRGKSVSSPKDEEKIDKDV